MFPGRGFLEALEELVGSRRVHLVGVHDHEHPTGRLERQLQEPLARPGHGLHLEHADGVRLVFLPGFRQGRIDARQILASKHAEVRVHALRDLLTVTARAAGPGPALIAQQGRRHGERQRPLPYAPESVQQNRVMESAFRHRAPEPLASVVMAQDFRKGRAHKSPLKRRRTQAEMSAPRRAGSASPSNTSNLPRSAAGKVEERLPHPPVEGRRLRVEPIRRTASAQALDRHGRRRGRSGS
jgi:hypothetical protein